MIPNINVLTQEITDHSYPGRTYNVVVDKNRVSGYTDDLAAVKQAIYLILSTERYKCLIYSWDYGVELVDLIGKPMPYVMSEIPYRIDGVDEDVREWRVELFYSNTVPEQYK